MKCLERGHVYELSNFGEGTQRLVFLKTLPEGDPVNHDGVQCQEVLRALIDRVNDLHIQVPCVENVGIIESLRKALILFEKRAAERTLEKSYKLTGLHVEQLPVSKANGHVFDIRPLAAAQAALRGQGGRG